MRMRQRKKLRIFNKHAAEALRAFSVCMFLLLFCLRYSEARGREEPARSRNAPAASRVQEENIKFALTSHPWILYVIYQSSINGKTASSLETDTLAFTQDTVLSHNLASQGYAKEGSGYKVKAGAIGEYVWESIQLHENQADIVLLKGELKDGIMKGVIVYQPQGGPAKTAIFTTVRPE